MFIGWDWATETHDVTVLDDNGRVIDRWSFEHSERGLRETFQRLREHGLPGDLPVAIELANGLVVDRLVAAGHPVFPVHATSFNAARARWGASRAKSDPGDSYRLADYLRTDGHRLRVLHELPRTLREVRALNRCRSQQLDIRRDAMRQLRSLLEAYWPGSLRLFHRVDADIFLSFVERYPTHASAAHLGEGRLAAFLARHHYPGKHKPADMVRRLREAPVPACDVEPAALETMVRAQVQLIRTLKRNEQALLHHTSAVVAQHPKSRIVASLPRLGRIGLNQLMGEIAPVLERARDVEHAAAEIGAVPVTKESGKGRSVVFRWSVNRRARNALTLYADNSRHGSAWAQAVYLRARARGKRHPHAIRILARAWLRVLWACWHADELYSTANHRAFQALVSPQAVTVAA